jgi:hypothetical protein
MDHRADHELLRVSAHGPAGELCARQQSSTRCRSLGTHQDDDARNRTAPPAAARPDAGEAAKDPHDAEERVLQILVCPWAALQQV